MSDEFETLDCSEHGEAYTTYVCEHLVKDPVQHWHAAHPSDEDPWPDAWCTQCNVELLKEGEWNEKNEEGLVVKILCHLCYEAAQGRSVARLTGDVAEAWDVLIEESMKTLRRKQRTLEKEFEIDKHKRWDWDQEKAELIFSNDGVPAVRCDIAFIGSVSEESKTWLWAWANFSLFD